MIKIIANLFKDIFFEEKQNEDLMRLARIEYKKDTVFAYEMLKRGLNPHDMMFK